MAILPVRPSLILAILSAVVAVLSVFPLGAVATAAGSACTVAGWCDGVDNFAGTCQKPSMQQGWDPVGLAALGAIFIIAAVYLAVCEVKRRHTEASQAPIPRGAFRLAAARGEVENLDLLWRLMGAKILGSVDAGTASGFTALHAAAVGGHAEACLWLCKKGADVSAVKNDGWLDSPLHLAAAAGSLECCKVLLAYGANPKACNYAGRTPASIAARNGYASLASWLELATGGALSKPSPAEAEQGISSKEREIADALLHRPWDGMGSEGTVPAPAMWGYRISATLMLGFWLWYLVWRALFSLKAGWWYLYSIPALAVEAYFWLDTIPQVICLWHQIDRPGRKLSNLLKRPEDYPTVDVIIMCCTEPVDVIQATAIAARNMNYPADKLAVYVCDDGGRDDVEEMVVRVHAAAGGPPLRYLRREKKHGVPHHAKAGSINSFLLKEGTTRGSHVLVLDSDMVVHPDFLESCLGHFYEPAPEGNWVRKRKCAFLQTAQDFWNITPSEDQLERAIRMYFGPMAKGRDGCGAAACCGTGVLFDRAALVSVGGQAYGSLAEDYFTSMELSSAGFSSMYLNDRLVFGINTDDIKELLKQRLRWSTGMLQIFYHDNPLCNAGLTAMQRFQYFSDCTYPMAVLPFVFSCLVPLLFLFSAGFVCPVQTVALPLWQTVTLAFVVFAFMELAVWCALAGNGAAGTRATTERLVSAQQTQQSYWIAPTHLNALWDVLKAETGLRRLFRSVHLEFIVTAKNMQHTKPEGVGRGAAHWDFLVSSLRHLWPLLAFVLLSVAAILRWASAIVGKVDMQYVLLSLIMIAWTLTIIMNLWPVLMTLLPGGWGHPRGWKIIMRQVERGPRLVCILDLLLRLGFLALVAWLAWRHERERYPGY